MAVKTTEQFIADARRVHRNKYNYNKVRYTNNKANVTIICPDHGEFQQIANNHLSGYGCPSCGGTKKKTTEEFTKEARKIHGDKYDYSRVDYKNGNSKVTIICPDHGEFMQEPKSHTHLKCGCPSCSGTKKKTTEEFVKEARKVHGDKYEYSRVDYKNAKSNVTIICPDHGEFMQSCHHHVSSKHGCPSCGGTKKKTAEEFVKEAQKVHGDKYEYSRVDYINNKTKVTIICPDHGEFMQEPFSHLCNVSGCPICKSSKGECKIQDYLDRNSIKHKYQWSFLKSNLKRSKFDFAIRSRMFIGVNEYHGQQHYTPCSFGSKKKHAKQHNLLKSIKRDHKKLEWCRRHKIPLLIIPYWDKNRIPEILDDVFAGRTPTFSEPPEIVKKNALLRKKIRDHFGITEPEVLCGLIRIKE